MSLHSRVREQNQGREKGQERRVLGRDKTDTIRCDA